MSKPSEPKVRGPVHRVLVAPVAPGVTKADAHRHWRERHSKVVPDIQALVGYVQNRPLPDYWERPFLVCAESWFSSRRAEGEAYASDYYNETIVVDEERFIDRGGAWHSPVVGTRLLLDGPRTGFRALCFGGDSGDVDPAAGWLRVEVLELRRPITAGVAPTILSAWTDDPERAAELAESAAGLSLVAAPTAVVPPSPDWRGAGMEWSW